MISCIQLQKYEKKKPGIKYCDDMSARDKRIYEYEKAKQDNLDKRNKRILKYEKDKQNNLDKRNKRILKYDKDKQDNLDKRNKRILKYDKDKQDNLDIRNKRILKYDKDKKDNLDRRNKRILKYEKDKKDNLDRRNERIRKYDENKQKPNHIVVISSFKNAKVLDNKNGNFKLNNYNIKSDSQAWYYKDNKLEIYKKGTDNICLNPPEINNKFNYTNCNTKGDIAFIYNFNTNHIKSNKYDTYLDIDPNTDELKMSVYNPSSISQKWNLYYMNKKEVPTFKLTCISEKWKDEDKDVGWGTCDKLCGTGKQMRRNQKILYDPKNGDIPKNILGKNYKVVSSITSCPKLYNNNKKLDMDLVEERKCNENTCSVDCVLSDWSEWSDCGKECGGGEQKRTKTISVPASHGGKTCGKKEETQKCNEKPCPIDCVLSNWGEWDSCNDKTGLEKREKTIITESSDEGKKCGDLIEERKCCNIQTWQNEDDGWKKCNCKTTKKVRIKNILSKMNNMCPSKQNRSEEKECKADELKHCPIDCVLADPLDDTLLDFQKYEELYGGLARKLKPIQMAENGGRTCSTLINPIESTDFGKIIILASVILIFFGIYKIIKKKYDF
jgi:hypothetical protein